MEKIMLSDFIDKYLDESYLKCITREKIELVDVDGVKYIQMYGKEVDHKIHSGNLFLDFITLGSKLYEANQTNFTRKLMVRNYNEYDTLAGSSFFGFNNDTIQVHKEDDDLKKKKKDDEHNSLEHLIIGFVEEWGLPSIDKEEDHPLMPSKKFKHYMASKLNRFVNFAIFCYVSFSLVSYYNEYIETTKCEKFFNFANNIFEYDNELQGKNIDMIKRTMGTLMFYINTYETSYPFIAARHNELKMYNEPSDYTFKMVTRYDSLYGLLWDMLKFAIVNYGYIDSETRFTLCSRWGIVCMYRRSVKEPLCEEHKKEKDRVRKAKEREKESLS